MAKYESEVKFIPSATAEQVYSKLSDLETFRPILENAANNPMVKEKMQEMGQDPSKLESLKDVQLTSDRISFPAPMVGEVAFAVVEREPSKLVKLHTEKSPVEATLWIQMLPVSAGGSKMRLTLEADIPFYLKPMIGSKLKTGINQFADMLAGLPYNMF